MGNDAFGIYRNGQYSASDDLFFLRLFSEYSDVPTGKVNITYQPLNSPELSALREKYKLDDLAGDGDDLKRVSNVRQWIHRYFLREEDIQPFNTMVACEKPFEWNADIMMEHGKDMSFKADCATLAAVLTEMLIALGFKAIWVQCLPIDLRHEESHCITHVYIESLKKWIVVDAAQDLFYFDRKGVPLSLSEMRKSFIKDDRVFIFAKEEKLDGRKKLIYYWWKNIFRFRCFENSAYGFLGRKPQTSFYLNPYNYNIQDKVSEDSIIGQHIHTNCEEEFFEVKL